MCFNYPVSGFIWGDFVSLFSFPSSPVFIHVDKIPLSLLLCRVKSPLCLWKRCSSHFSLWPCVWLFPATSCLSYTGYPRTTVSMSAAGQDKIDIPGPGGCWLSLQKESISFSQSASCPWAPRSFPAELFPGQTVPSVWSEWQQTCSCFIHSFQVFCLKMCWGCSWLHFFE